MRTADFDFDLPPELIAQEPLTDRSGSRLLVVDRASGRWRHDVFRNVGHHLQPGDLLVLNDTRVLPARLWSTDPPLEVLLVEKLDPQRWTALVKPARRARLGARLRFGPMDVTPVTKCGEPPCTARLGPAELEAVVEGPTEFGGRVLRFSGDVEAHMERFGAAPLPPYIRRPPGGTAADRERYQTVFARVPGAIAAPTAGLHFTPELLVDLAGRGIPHTFVTLHVGIGTFRPVKTETVEEHKLHAERFAIGEPAAAAMRAARRIVAVGTTVARTLEAVGSPRPAAGATDLFIRPPYEFRVVGALLTNFHLPRSTLLMLVSALAGRELILAAYADAVRERYRFFSYGDCMLIL
jgi:S-adenosylmethionine:tRNA ribosyltransferase-isomerase